MRDSPLAPRLSTLDPLSGFDSSRSARPILAERFRGLLPQMCEGGAQWGAGELN